MIKGKVVTTIIYFRYSGIFNKLFSVCKFIIDRTFYGKVEIIAKNFRDTKCISGLKSFAGRGGGRVIYLGILSNVKIFRESFTQDDKV